MTTDLFPCLGAQVTYTWTCILGQMQRSGLAEARALVGGAGREGKAGRNQESVSGRNDVWAGTGYKSEWRKEEREIYTVKQDGRFQIPWESGVLAQGWPKHKLAKTDGCGFEELCRLGGGVWDVFHGWGWLTEHSSTLQNAPHVVSHSSPLKITLTGKLLDEQQWRCSKWKSLEVGWAPISHSFERTGLNRSVSGLWEKFGLGR